MLKKFLKSDKKIEYFDEISSTNTVLKEMAKNGTPKDTILLSEYQSAGRGRLGKTFFSPKGCGVYLSYLLKPDILPNDAVFITVAAAVSMVRALKKVFALDAKIKWVNDIYIDNKKLAGILTEGSIRNENELDFAVLGIGINTKNPPNGYPDEFSYKVTNLETITGNVPYDKKWQLVAEFINIFDEVFADKTRAYIKEYKDASMLIGQKIEILSGEEKGFATAIDIDSSARLVVEKDKKIYYLDSGDVSVRFT